MAIPPREQRHRFLRVQVVDFQVMPELLRDGLFARMAMEHRDEAGVVVFTSQAWGRLFSTRGPLFRLGGAKRLLSWRQFILALGLHIGEEMESPDFSSSNSKNILKSFKPNTILRLCHRMTAHSIAGRSQAPEKVTVTDLFYLRGLDVGSVNIPYLLARYLRKFAAERKSGEHISAEDAPAVDEGEQDVPAPVQAPQQPPLPPPAPARTMP
ncbi:hypothetical protein Tco_0964505 [Tanacetum coccineum]